MNILAVIPARAGSKRIPGKNKKILAGKPLIQWTIDAAKKVKGITDIVVSTDDNDILLIAEKNGVIAYNRKKELASDTANSVDVVIDIINNLEKKYEFIILLQPTSPLRDNVDIEKAIEILKEKNADAIISVCESEHPVQWMNLLPEDCSLSNFLSPDNNKRSQDLEKYFRLNGAIYICRTSKILSEKTLFIKDNIFAYKMNRENSIDIDEEIDFKIAEIIMREKKLIK